MDKATQQRINKARGNVRVILGETEVSMLNPPKGNMTLTPKYYHFHLTHPMTTHTQPDIMERVRAARIWLDGERDRNGENNKAMELAAFMSIFHPEIKGKKLQATTEPL